MTTPETTDMVPAPGPGGSKHVLAVFIGRFQPFHDGHTAVMRHAMRFADSALVLVGSAFRPRSPKNPLSYTERAGIIATVLRDATIPVSVTPLVDTLYDDAAWGANVRAAVGWHIRSMGHAPEDVDVVLTGYEKDKSSAYVRWFPDWGWNGAPVHEHAGETVSATGLRMAFYGLADTDEETLIARYGAEPVGLLWGWAERNEEAANELRQEALVTATAKARHVALEEAWGYPIALNTVDAVVICDGHLCVVRRGLRPGLGLMALPGGHFDAGETALEAAKRELREETGLDLGDMAPAARQVFDHPDRSERGWVRTEAFVFRLEGPCPALTAGDDAAEARWIPLAEVTSDLMFEDHFDILETLLDEVPNPYLAALTARRG